MSGPSVITPDGSLARIGAKSYAVNKINSVEVRATRPHRRPSAVLALSVAALFCFVGGKSFLALAITFTVGAVVLWLRGRIVEYRLLLTTSSSEIAALKSKDLQLVNSVRSEIEAAMAR